MSAINKYMTSMLVASLLLVAGAIALPSSTRRAVHGPEATPIPLPISTRVTPDCSGATDLNIAMCEFQDLTSAKQQWSDPNDTVDTTSVPPIWTEWLDKCNLNIGQCVQGEIPVSSSNPCPPIPSTGNRQPALRPNRPQISDVLAVAAATQITVDNHEKHHQRIHGAAPLTPVNELSSVLFSPEMCSALEGITTTSQATAAINAAQQLGLVGGARDIANIPTMTAIPSKATAIKLIWEIVYDRDTTYGAHIYYPAGDVGETEPVKPIDYPIQWSTFYTIDTTPSSPCIPEGSQQIPSPGTPESPVLLSINCFYHIAVDKSNPAIKAVIKNNTTNIIPAPPLPDEDSTPYLILVGAHVMVLNTAHPLWQWMTFYWTPGLDASAVGLGWKDPWQHYQMATTSAPGEALSLTVARTDVANPYLKGNAVANPYLEGNIDGMGTNCLSCHSLAVYSPSIKNPADQSACAATIVRNDRSADPAGEYPKTEQDAVSANYFTPGIRTHFLWSVTTNPVLYKGSTGKSQCAFTTGSQSSKRKSSQPNPAISGR